MLSQSKLDVPLHTNALLHPGNSYGAIREVRTSCSTRGEKQMCQHWDLQEPPELVWALGASLGCSSSPQRSMGCWAHFWYLLSLLKSSRWQKESMAWKQLSISTKAQSSFSCVAQNRQQDACQAAQHCSGVLRDIQIFPLATQHKPTIHVPTQNYSPFSQYPARTILFRLPASSASENKIQSLISEMQHCADLCLRRSLQQMGDPLLEEPVETSSTALLHHGLRRWEAYPKNCPKKQFGFSMCRTAASHTESKEQKES